MSLGDDEWTTIRSESRVTNSRRNAAMRKSQWLSVSEIAWAARLSVSQTRRILSVAAK